ncbi:MAG: glycoside hydrolase family 43 protein [Verrucomicrobiota bacterium]
MHKSLPLALSLIAVAPFLGAEIPPANPFVQTIYTADPAPLVHDGTVYVYTTHDEDDSTWFTMYDWRCYSSTDMVNWTDHGVVLSVDDLTWANKNAWAPQAIERNGKFYFYFPVERNEGGMAIGVAVSDSPTGPFEDALGEPLVFDESGDIDPSVFIDVDGQAYLSWGNPTYKWVRLNEDMISYDTSVGDNGIFRHPMTVEAFGERTTDDRATSYEEGPWFYLRDGLYYMFFAGGPVPEHLAYSTAPSPEGPWSYGGVIMPTQGGAFTNHPGVVDYKGQTYLFYHNAALPGGGGFNRSVCVDELEFGPDGEVIPLDMDPAGVAPVGTLDPYSRVEAETIAWTGGVETQRLEDRGMVVYDIDDGDFIRVREVAFGEKGARRFTATVRGEAGGMIELRLDTPDGPLAGTLEIPSTDGKWRTLRTRVEGATGTRDLYLVFKGEAESEGELFAFDWWRFRR